MKCSSCSAEIKPIVALDIDGTMGDYHGHFLRFLFTYIGIEIDPKIIHKIPRYDIHLQSFGEYCRSHWALSPEEYRAIKLAYRQGAQKRSMPIFTGAQALAWSIRDAGAELWITTTRPFLSLDTVMTDTLFWLQRHEIEFDGMLFDADKYAVLARQVDPRRVVAVFEDIPTLVDAANLHFPGRGWMVKGAWNQGERRPLMCDLDSAADLARNAIYTWKGMH